MAGRRKRRKRRKRREPLREGHRPTPTIPHSQFSIPIPFLPCSICPSPAGLHFQAVRDARLDVIFPLGMVKRICWSCCQLRGGTSSLCLGPGAAGVWIWCGFGGAVPHPVCFDSLAGQGWLRVCEGCIPRDAAGPHPQGHLEASRKHPQGWGRAGWASLHHGMV